MRKMRLIVHLVLYKVGFFILINTSYSPKFNLLWEQILRAALYKWRHLVYLAR